MVCIHAYIPHYVHIIIKYLQGVTDNKIQNRVAKASLSGARLYVTGAPDDHNIEKILLTVMSLLPESDVELTSAN